MPILPYGKGVYLIHFDRPLAHAQHYIGYADKVSSRVIAHRLSRWHRDPETGRGVHNGRGARLLGAVNYYGIDWRVARVWKGRGRSFERLLKNRKHARYLCPICNPLSAERYPVERKPSGPKLSECPF